ncbi:MAG: hypothetical protein AB7S75_08300 [Desulfococcaceae bacterium]
MGKIVLFLFISLFVTGIFSAGFAQTSGQTAKDAAAGTGRAPAGTDAKDFKTEAPAEANAEARVKNAKTETVPSAVQEKDSSAPNAAESKTESPAILSPGLYHYEENTIEFSEEEDGFSGTGSQKLQMDLKTDGIFAITTYVTIPEAGIQNQAIINFRGRWKQDGDKLIQSEILVQYYDFDNNSFSPWEAPEHGETEVTVKIRNITPGTFQEYDENSGTWVTWSRL